MTQEKKDKINEFMNYIEEQIRRGYDTSFITGRIRSFIYEIAEPPSETREACKHDGHWSMDLVDNIKCLRCGEILTRVIQPQSEQPPMKELEEIKFELDPLIIGKSDERYIRNTIGELVLTVNALLKRVHQLEKGLKI